MRCRPSAAMYAGMSSVRPSGLHSTTQGILRSTGRMSDGATRTKHRVGREWVFLVVLLGLSPPADEEQESLSWLLQTHAWLAVAVAFVAMAFAVLWAASPKKLPGRRCWLMWRWWQMERHPAENAEVALRSLGGTESCCALAVASDKPEL